MVQIIVIFSAFVSAFYEALHVVMYGYICWVCLVCDSFLFRLVCVLGFVLGGYVGELVYWYFFVVFVFSLSVFCCCLFVFGFVLCMV